MIKNSKEFNEAWWVDFMEGEVDQCIEQDMKMVMKHSETDRLIFENLKLMKNEIKKSAMVDMPMDEQYYMNMNDKIMAQVNMTKMETRPLYRRVRVPRAIKNLCQSLVRG